MTFRRVFSDYFHDGINYLTHRVEDYTRNKFDEYSRMVEHKVIGLQNRMIKRLASSLFFFSSMIFIVLGVFYFMKEYFNVSNTISLSTIGVGLFMVGLIIRLTERKY